MINKSNICWFLLGPTGIGKTYVSLKIGQKFNNEIINTDAFSLYKEASIMTAKATKNEMSLVKHRMINILDLFDTKYHQKLFKKDALNEINSVFENDKIPLIVGGTNYFVESLLFDYENESNKEDNKNGINMIDSFEFLEKNDYIKNLKIFDKYFLDEIKLIKEKNIDEDECYTKLNEYMTANFSEENGNKNILHKILSIIDPKSANFYNDNDTRRIINSISYFISFNRKKSEALNNQIIKLNFEKNKLIILLPKKIDNLLKRITSRINQMIEEGLSEIIYIFHKFRLNGKEINFEVGVLQSIGYKEFYELYQELNCNIINEIYNNYLKEINSDEPDKIKQYNKNILENIIYKDNKLKNIFENCKQKLISNTLNYAKYQIKFIKKRILAYLNGFKIIEINDFNKETYINEYIPQIEDYLKNDDYISVVNINKNKIEEWKRYFCDICGCEMNGENDYNNHMKSNKHKKQKAKLRKKEKEKINENKKDKDINEVENKISEIDINNDDKNIFDFK